MSRFPVPGAMAVYGAVLFSVASLGLGCASKSRPAVLDRPGTPPPGIQVEQEPAILTDGQRREIAAVFDDLPPDEFQSDSPPRTAGPRGRWSDVPTAMQLAVSQPGVDMVLMQSHVVDDRRWTFRLRTLSDLSVLADVRATDDERVYDIDVRVGFFGHYRDEERELVRAFERLMHRLGQKRSFD